MLSIFGESFRCPDCGEKCEAVMTYDPQMNENVDAWKCHHCDSLFYREEEDGVTFHGVANRLSGKY